MQAAELHSPAAEIAAATSLWLWRRGQLQGLLPDQMLILKRVVKEGSGLLPHVLLQHSKVLISHSSAAMCMAVCMAAMSVLPWHGCKQSEHNVLRRCCAWLSVGQECLLSLRTCRSGGALLHM